MRRSQFFWIVIAVVVALAIEGIGRIAYRMTYGYGYSTREIRSRGYSGPESSSVLLDEMSRSDNDSEDSPIGLRQDVLHPYLGFVEDGNVANHGFHTDREVLALRQPGSIVVALLGGSVASDASAYLDTALGQRLPEGLELRFINLALRGYKQPQQLLATAYLLSLGAMYDIVINLDGFNEAVLPVVENESAKTYLFYPRRWETRIDRRPSALNLRRIGKIAYLRDRERELRTRTLQSPLRISALFGLVQRRRIDGIADEISRAEFEVQSAPRGGGFEAHGPYRAYDNLNTLARSLSEVWFRSSQMIAQIVTAHGGEYYHFLQPNQYLSGSKPLSKRERRIAIAVGDHAPMVRLVYPLMAARGSNLRRSGGRFIDATRVFESVNKTLYIDNCCHLNPDGYRRLVRFMANTVRASSRHFADR